MRIIPSLAAALVLTAPALAQDLDTDGDGNVTFVELQAAYPEVTEDTFLTIDTDQDGVLSVAEIEAAVAAGQLPA